MMMNMKTFVKTSKGMKIPWESKALFRQLATVFELKTKLIINFFLVAKAILKMIKKINFIAVMA